MFMHKNARCQQCDRVFCCSVHCDDHKKKCIDPSTKRGLRKSYMISHSLNNSSNRTIPTESEPEANNYAKRKDTPRLSRKRKLGNFKLYNPHHVITPMLNPINRKKLVAVRNKYKRVISPMQTIKEEEEPIEPIVASTIKAQSNIEPYKAFQIGSLKDSPIVATTPAPGILPKLENDVKTGVLTSTPNELSTNNQPYKLINKIGPSGDLNICCSTPKETTEVPPLPANHDHANIPPENINIAKVTALVSPILAEVTPGQNSMSKRKVPDSPWESENATYYTAKSFFSPQYSSLVGTPLQNPSLFTSVKDAFRNFVCLLPGTSTDDALKICSSPLRKRSKQIVLSPIRCRPTFRGRYLENTSPDSYFSLQNCSTDKLSFTKQ